MPYRNLFFVLIIVSLSGKCFPQAFDTKKLDEYLDVMDRGQKFMGNVLLYQHNKKLYSYKLGFSNIEMKEKSNDQTMYRIGSVSKTITATLVLKAIEEGKIKFTDNIGTFFPSIKNADKITIGYLLNHHSGVHNFTGGNFMDWNTEPKNRHDLVDSIAKGGSDFEPGSKAAYSNSNFVLLSFILEDIYHEQYGVILNKKIIQPLRLKHFQFGDEHIPSNKKALSYYFEAGWNASPKTDLSIPMGAGAMLSSADDLTKVLDAIFHGKVISGQMVDKMKAQADGYGYGLFEKNIFGQVAYTHDGAIDGFNTYFYYFPQDETMYVLLSNADNYNLESVNSAILSIVFNKPVVLPKLNKYNGPVADLDQYSGTYTSKGSPLIIEIWGKNGFLLAQPHGQKIYTMEASGTDTFLHEKTGVTLVFVPQKKEMTLTQGSQTLVFIKQ